MANKQKNLDGFKVELTAYHMYVLTSGKIVESAKLHINQVILEEPEEESNIACLCFYGKVKANAVEQDFGYYLYLSYKPSLEDTLDLLEVYENRTIKYTTFVNQFIAHLGATQSWIEVENTKEEYMHMYTHTSLNTDTDGRNINLQFVLAQNEVDTYSISNLFGKHCVTTGATKLIVEEFTAEVQDFAYNTGGVLKTSLGLSLVNTDGEPLGKVEIKTILVPPEEEVSKWTHTGLNDLSNTLVRKIFEKKESGVLIFPEYFSILSLYGGVMHTQINYERLDTSKKNN